MRRTNFINTLTEFEAISDVQRVARHVDGWLTDLEGTALYLAAAHGPSEGQVVELGSFKGKSTIWLASGSKHTDRGPVYAVDTHQGSSEHQAGGEFASHMPAEGTTEPVFRENITRAGLEDCVVPIIEPSLAAAASWTEPIRLLFIDAAHEYESVRADFMAWQKHVVLGGLVAFHDVDRPDGRIAPGGPSKVVYEDVAQIGSYSEPVIVNHLAFVSKIR